MSDRIFSRVEGTIKKFDTRDPFAILDSMNVVTHFSDSYTENGLKGFCIVLNRIKYVVINQKLCEEDQRVTAAHELGHIVMHGKELSCRPFRDFNIYQASSRMEREANFYGADLLISDEEVTDLMNSGGSDFFSVARALSVPCEFFAFKLYSMVERGLPMNMPVELKSDFLAGKRRR